LAVDPVAIFSIFLRAHIFFPSNFFLISTLFFIPLQENFLKKFKIGVSLVVDHALPQRATGIFCSTFSDHVMETRAALNFMVATWNVCFLIFF
jgi:hypothetical protein